MAGCLSVGNGMDDGPFIEPRLSSEEEEETVAETRSSSNSRSSSRHVMIPIFE